MLTLALTMLFGLGTTEAEASRAEASRAASRADDLVSLWSDQGVTDAVERELVFDDFVSSNDLDVSSEQGVVTIEGTVPSILAKDRAVRIAETVKGVKSIVDLIAVLPHRDLTDEEIKRDIEHALLADPAAESYEVSVEVQEGRAKLSGTVDSWAEKQLCERVAKGVKGVTGITNEIAMSYESERIDQEIRHDIVETLRWDYLVDDGLIDVSVVEGAVSLSGTVGSAAEKRQARTDAWTMGVRSVDDSGLTVARWARDEDLRKEKYVSRSDEEIEKAVRKAFVKAPRVFSFGIDASVSAGVVTLRGVVDNLKAKRAAEQDARNTVGVVSTKNHLKVRPAESREDHTVAQDIRDALLRDPYVERYQTTVSVHDGTAYLHGEVDSYLEKSRAEDIASRVQGVVDVNNNLRVEESAAYVYDPWVDRWSHPYVYDWYRLGAVHAYHEDWLVQRDIGDELFWSPFVDADEVTVTVEDGTATLTGTVDSYMERGAARDNAYEGGASYVRNKLIVE